MTYAAATESNDRNVEEQPRIDNTKGNPSPSTTDRWPSIPNVDHSPVQTSSKARRNADPTVAGSTPAGGTTFHQLGNES